MPPDDEKQKLSEVIFKLSQRMARLDPGSLARLRRMDPEGPGETEFWKLALDCDLGTDARHQMLVRLLALLTPRGDPGIHKKLHDRSRALGTVLAETKFPETRLMRFLALPFGRRGEALERMVRWLAQKGHDGVNCTDIAALLLSDDDRAARRLAETHYRAVDRLNTTDNEDSAT